MALPRKLHTLSYPRKNHCYSRLFIPEEEIFDRLAGHTTDMFSSLKSQLGHVGASDIGNIDGQGTVMEKITDKATLNLRLNQK